MSMLLQNVCPVCGKAIQTIQIGSIQINRIFKKYQQKQMEAEN